MRLLFWCIGIGLLAAETVAAQRTSDPLIGTWHFISQEARDEQGGVSYPYGRSSDGRLTYDGEGHMFVLLFDPSIPKFASGDRLRGTSDEIRAAFERSVAYYGTYTVDRSAGSVTHHVLGSTFPNYVGTDQLRYYKIEGRRLYVSTAPFVLGGKTVTVVNTFERMD